MASFPVRLNFTLRDGRTRQFEVSTAKPTEPALAIYYHDKIFYAPMYKRGSSELSDYNDKLRVRYHGEDYCIPGSLGAVYYCATDSNVVKIKAAMEAENTGNNQRTFVYKIRMNYENNAQFTLFNFNIYFSEPFDNYEVKLFKDDGVNEFSQDYDDREITDISRSGNAITIQYDRYNVAAKLRAACGYVAYNLSDN